MKKTTLYNFNAGPAALPAEVLEAASQAITNFNGMGLSLLEIGHRTEPFIAVMEEARQLAKELLHLGEEHEVLFLHGGATTQFMQLPMNFLSSDKKAAYTETGTWSVKAIAEAAHFGTVEIAGSSKADAFRNIPKTLSVSPDAAYLHITTNETIAGTQWHDIPYTSGVPLVADMSSDIFSRTMQFSAFDMIYAGAQKNMGAAGVTMVVLKKSWAASITKKVPAIMDYRNHLKEESMLNTPPVFAVYVAMLTLRWLKAQGGIAAIEKINNAKAALLYQTIDQCTIYTAPIAKADRSKMNVVFTMQDAALEKKLLDECKQNGIYGIKGHRSVGGFRASLYNAVSLEATQVLSALLTDFAQRHG